MPILDMPLEKLKEYQGTNPCPQDMDAYWERALGEMRAMDAKVECRDASFQAPGLICQDLFFTGVGGARIHCNFVRPAHDDGKKHPAIVWFHGYTGAAAGFMSLLPYAYAGFYIASMDTRGQGGLSQDTQPAVTNSVYGHIVKGLNEGPENLFFRNVFLDTAQLAGIMMDMEQVDETRVGAMGGSQGGALTLACASLEPRIAVAAPQFPWLCDYKRVWDMDMDDRAYRGLRDYFRHFDPNHEKEEEIFTTLGYIDLQHLAKRIRARVTMFTGLMDDVCPPSTQFAAFNKIPSEKSVVIYPDFGHEGLPGCDEKTFALMTTLL